MSERKAAEAIAVLPEPERRNRPRKGITAAREDADTRKPLARNHAKGFLKQHAPEPLPEVEAGKVKLKDAAKTARARAATQRAPRAPKLSWFPMDPPRPADPSGTCVLFCDITLW